MKREEKLAIIENLAEKIKESSHFYLADISGLNAENTSKLRRACFKEDIQLLVVKNTLLRKALEQIGSEYDEIFESLKGNTSIMFTEVGNKPARLIKKFRKEHERPILKAAFVEESVYLGEENLEVLHNIKSKEELIGDLIGLLQSPMNNLLSQLKSGNDILSGVCKTLSEKE